MEVKINKEIRNYTESMFFGLSLRQFIFSVLACGVVDYEFRTTLCKELHGREEIEAIGKWLSGAKRYFLQNYRESDYVIDPRFSGYAREQLERFCEILRGKIETVEIRGVD